MFTLLSARNRRDLVRAFTPAPIWKVSVPGAVIGTYVAMLSWVAGFKYAEAITASILNQTATLLIVLLAAIFLHERLTALKILAVVMGTLGSVLAIV